MTEDAQKSRSEVASDLEDKEKIKDQDGGNGSTVQKEANAWPKNQENGIALYCITLVHKGSFSLWAGLGDNLLLVRK